MIHKVERRGTYQGVPQYSITGAHEITPSRATAEKWARWANEEFRQIRERTAAAQRLIDAPPPPSCGFRSEDPR
jgi:hypothetical protein